MHSDVILNFIHNGSICKIITEKIIYLFYLNNIYWSLEMIQLNNKKSTKNIKIIQFSPKIHRLKTHPFRHLRILKVFLLLPLVNLQVHIIHLITIGTILTRAMLSTLDSLRKARTILFVAFCFFTRAIRQSILLDCLQSHVAFLTVVLVLAWFAAAFFGTKLTVLETFAVWF